MKHPRGWAGVASAVVGIGLLFIEQTRSLAPVFIGFGLGMMSSGFNNG